MSSCETQTSPPIDTRQRKREYWTSQHSRFSMITFTQIFVPNKETWRGHSTRAWGFSAFAIHLIYSCVSMSFDRKWAQQAQWGGHTLPKTCHLKQEQTKFIYTSANTNAKYHHRRYPYRKAISLRTHCRWLRYSTLLRGRNYRHRCHQHQCDFQQYHIVQSTDS